MLPESTPVISSWVPNKFSPRILNVKQKEKLRIYHPDVFGGRQTSLDVLWCFGFGTPPWLKRREFWGSSHDAFHSATKNLVRHGWPEIQRDADEWLQSWLFKTNHMVNLIPDKYSATVHKLSTVHIIFISIWYTVNIWYMYHHRKTWGMYTNNVQSIYI